MFDTPIGYGQYDSSHETRLSCRRGQDKFPSLTVIAYKLIWRGAKQFRTFQYSNINPQPYAGSFGNSVLCKGRNVLSLKERKLMNGEEWKVTNSMGYVWYKLFLWLLII